MARCADSAAAGFFCLYPGPFAVILSEAKDLLFAFAQGKLCEGSAFLRAFKNKSRYFSPPNGRDFRMTPTRGFFTSLPGLGLGIGYFCGKAPAQDAIPIARRQGLAK